MKLILLQIFIEGNKNGIMKEKNYWDILIN